MIQLTHLYKEPRVTYLPLPHLGNYQVPWGRYFSAHFISHFLHVPPATTRIKFHGDRNSWLTFVSSELEVGLGGKVFRE